MKPAVGRLLMPEDDRAGTASAVVLSYPYWIAKFGGRNPAVVNETIVVNAQIMTVVGVTPRGYAGTTLEDDPKIYVPLRMAALMIPGWNGFDDRRDHWLYLFARLKPGFSREAAERGMSGPFAGILKDIEFPAQRSGLGTRAREEFAQRKLLLEPGKQGQRPERRELRSVFILLFCITGVVLLIACANVAGLLLARVAYRATDVTVRLSLGASRPQIIRQMLLESSLLAGFGAIGGLIVAAWILGSFSSAFPVNAGGYFQFRFDSTLFLFTVALSGGIALLIGMYPALYGTRQGLTSSLKGATTSSATRSATRFRTSLATAQIALSIGLLVVAGLFTQSLLNVARVDLGIRTENLTTFRLSPELNGYTPERARVLADRIEQELVGLPGVRSVSESTIPVLGGVGGGSNVTVDAFGTRVASERGVYRANIGAEYFRTVGIPLVAGREFSPSDNLGAPHVAIVNEAFARTYTRGQNPIGLRMAEGAGNKIQLDIEIVGLVRDARYSQIKDAPPAQYFLPYRQSERFGSLNFYVRSTQPAEQVVLMIPATVGRIDGTLPIENLGTMEDQVRSTQGLDRLLTTLSAAFAILATTLAAIGLYGVLSFTVVQRRREIGLRIALGADATSIYRLVLARVGWMTLLGSALGLITALALGQLARAQLFGVERLPPSLFVAAVISASIVALSAGAIPAWRAARVDPMVVLRTE
jgi:predicted permease